MSNLIQNNVKLLLSQHKFTLEDDQNDNLFCILCKKMMFDPCQTYCECLYCRSCIADYLSRGERHCCGGKAECKEEYLVLDGNVQRNIVLNRKILKVKVCCPNQSCSYTSILTQMEDHLRICTKQAIECPYLSIGCDTEKATKEQILNHLHTEALPHTQLLVDLIQNLRNDFGVLKDNFESIKKECGEKEKRIKSLEEESRQREGENNEMKKCIDDMKIENAELKRENGEIKSQFECIKEEFQKKEKRIAALEEYFLQNDVSSEKQQRDIETLTQAMQGSEVKINKVQTEMVTLKTNVDSANIIDCNTRARIDELSNSIWQINMRTNMTGEILFGVYAFDHIKDTVNYLWSPYFYSHVNGYKIRLLVYPGGYKSGSGTHLSVFIHICKGEYDDLLSWPCRHVFTVSIVDRRPNRPPCNESITSYDSLCDEFYYCFEKPTIVDNVSIGDPKFISHHDLMTIEGLMVKNRITIKCTAKPPSN